MFNFNVMIESWQDVESVLMFSKAYFIEFNKLDYDQCLDTLFYRCALPISDFIAGYKQDEKNEQHECEIFNYIINGDVDLSQTIKGLKEYAY